MTRKTGIVIRKKSGGGGHGGSWVVSFADLMSLLMAFFVMLLSFSVQDQEKLNQATGSVQDAFGMRSYSFLAGVIEREGNPERDYVLQVTRDPTEAETEFSTAKLKDSGAEGELAASFSKDETDIDRAAQFALAAASLKQAWQDMPELTPFRDNIIFEETEEGLNILIADQDGRAMFPEGSKYPFEATRKALAAMAPALARLPNGIRISGHTAAGTRFDNPHFGKWELSAERANVVRQILEEFGLPDDRIDGVTGRGDAEPFFPNDPYLAANERVAIEIIYEQPPVPLDLTP